MHDDGAPPPNPPPPLTRVLALARAGIEGKRQGRAVDGPMSDWSAIAPDLGDHRQRSAMLKEIESTLVAKRGGGVVVGRAYEEDAGVAARLMRDRAALELQQKTDTARIAELEAALARERDEHRQAIESLGLQQRKLKALQEERDKLLADLSEQDARLRRQINETEQLTGRLEKLKASRQSVSDQATDAVEENNKLREENAALRQAVEDARQERDSAVARARAEVALAEGNTADAAYQKLWLRLRTDVPEVFRATHIPTPETFERVCDLLVHLIRVFAFVEIGVLQKLNELKDVADPNDPVTAFLVRLKRLPLAGSLDRFLAVGDNRADMRQLVFSLQAWAEAVGTGLYKAVVRSAEMVRDQINPRSWPLPREGLTDAAIGKYLRDVGIQAISDRLGTDLRRIAADLAHQDYEFLIQRRK